ncbi:MAG: Eco57I restriction-modification methylase domain-containing protein [Clostridia bacterium]|nr:Eco57I restriction-modification methylase domain-containing protein [Clostridia bacterium]
MKNQFHSTFEYKLIYVFRINDENHKNLVKIGDATIHTDCSYDALVPNCKELNQAAKARINTYTSTAGIVYELLHTEIAIRVKNGQLKAFRDKAVHSVLIRSGVKRHLFPTESQGQEWFETDLATAVRAIQAVKDGMSSLNSEDISQDDSPIIFRPEQKKAIKDTLAQFKSGNRMLWNAKMRFGKTLCALEVAKQADYKKILIFTHRPVVSDGWFDDFHKIFKGTTYKFGSKTKGETIETLITEDCPFVYFASIQDLRGSAAVGGKFDKNDYVFLIDWDYIIVDEAHEGTQTTLGQKVLEAVLSNNPKKTPKLLELSGTPFNLLNDFKQSEIYTWDYIMEQKAKAEWGINHFGDSNPYEELPQLEIFTYDLDKLIPGFIDVEDSAFNFREFFRTWTGDIKKDYRPLPEGANIGDFVHKDDVNAFLSLLCTSDEYTNFPYSTEENRSYYRHTLWMLPGVKEAKALSALMHEHPVFGNGQFFKIVNVAGDGDEEQNYKDALDAVRTAIGENPDDHYTITLSCGRLTTGVNIPEWTAVFMLAGSFSTSAANYLQTIFRVQTPANINGRMKTHCSVFDFAPDRTLKMVAEAGHLSLRTGNVGNDRILMGEFLNFCPVISISGSNMSPYNVDSLLQQLKRAYTDRVVKSGFEDTHIYNDNLLRLDDIDLQDFEELKKIIGATKQTKPTSEIVINDTGLTDEQYEELARIEKKKKKDLTEEQKALLEERKKKRDNAQKAMDILRGISIRIPLMIYGADIPVDKDITPDNFVDLIDDSSWEEFMPNGVTKEKYRLFAKYYEQDVFVAAARQIRQMALSADDLAPTERVKKIAEIFSIFRNPDKETVLTPWRVVNMHLSDCLGGYRFFNEDYTDTLDEPVFVDRGTVTTDLFKNNDVRILEINSKTGLYPLYVVYSIFRHKMDSLSKYDYEHRPIDDIWREVVEENLFVICKTPMAKAITKRTLLGYKRGKINAHAFDDLINQLKEKPQQFREKVLRGSFWNKGVRNMVFDAIVGNPPYQEAVSSSDSNRSLSRQLFPEFMKASILLKPKYASLITPSRWFAGEAQDGSFISLREFIQSNNHIKKITHFPVGNDVFDNVVIKGGVSYYLYEEGYVGEVSFSNSRNGVLITQDRPLFEEGLDIIISNSDDVELISKVTKEGFVSLTTITKGRNAFGIIGKPEVLRKIIHKEKFVGAVKLQCKNEEIYWVEAKEIIKNEDLMRKYKVFISKSAGDPSKDAKVIGRAYVGEPFSACSDSLIPIGDFDNLLEAENLRKYLSTKFLRYIVSILKVSQNVTQIVYKFVPMQDFTAHSDIDWTKSVAEVDQQLYRKYNLSAEEIAFIEEKIKPME